MKKIILCLITILTMPSILLGLKKTTNLKRISFDISMLHSGNYAQKTTQEDPFWKLVKSLYIKHIQKNLDFKKKPTIPKIIHHVWLGGNFPDKYALWRNTWLTNHPDWQCILWTDKDVEALNLTNKKLYDKASNFGEKSDIARYEILYRFGGLYVDTDFECIKSFDVLHHCCDFYAGIDENPSAVFNGLIAAAPKHPLLKACIDNIKRNENAIDSTHEIVHRTGPHFFTKMLRIFLPIYNKRVVLFPTSFFYPWPSMFRNQNQPHQIAKWLCPESFAIHHWQVSWNNGIFE